MRSAVLLLCLLAACSKPDAKAILADRDPADLTLTETVSNFGGKANAWWIYMFATQLIEEPFVGDAFGSPHESDDPCPRVRTDGDKRVITGGCTTRGGIRIEGSATIESSDRFRPTRIVYEDYATFFESKCDSERKVTTSTRWHGTLTGSTGEDGVYTFDVALTVDATRLAADTSCELRPFSFATVYHGTAVELAPDNNNDSFPDESRFDGAGTFALPNGKVEATTEGFHITTDLCVLLKDGKTTLTAGDHVAVVDYGKDAKCNSDISPATWSLDGEEKGRLELAMCNAGSPELSVWMLLAFVLSRRSRRGSGAAGMDRRERSCLAGTGATSIVRVSA